MEEFRKKQKKLKTALNAAVISSVIYAVIYYGAAPAVLKSLGKSADTILLYILYALILSAMILLFNYTSKYSKTDKILEYAENEISDTGYYITSRNENSVDDYSTAVKNDLESKGFSITENESIDDLEFDYTARKKNEFFYIVNTETLEKSDVIAYLDSAIYDITTLNIRRKGNGVVLFVCEKALDDAVSYSKATIPVGRQEKITFSLAVAEVPSKRVYFLGNVVTKRQQMIANFVMNCEVPLKDEYKGKEKLPFQNEFKEHMQNFNLKDYNNGNFYIH